MLLVQCLRKYKDLFKLTWLKAMGAIVMITWCLSLRSSSLLAWNIHISIFLSPLGQFEPIICNLQLIMHWTYILYLNPSGIFHYLFNQSNRRKKIEWCFLLWKQQIFINKQHNFVSVEKVMIKLISQPALLAYKSPAIKQIELVVSITTCIH